MSFINDIYKCVCARVARGSGGGTPARRARSASWPPERPRAPAPPSPPQPALPTGPARPPAPRPSEASRRTSQRGRGTGVRVRNRPAIRLSRARRTTRRRILSDAYVQTHLERAAGAGGRAQGLPAAPRGPTLRIVGAELLPAAGGREPSVARRGERAGVHRPLGRVGVVHDVHPAVGGLDPGAAGRGVHRDPVQRDER
jgi:hypothetical protein